MSNNLDNKLFFMLYGNKASKYHPCFRAERSHLCFIIKGASRYHPRIILEWPYVCGKSRQVLFSFLELIGITFALSMAVPEGFFFALLLKATSEEKRWQSLILIQRLMLGCSKSCWI